MDPLRPLVAAGAEGLMAKLERNVLYGIIFGVLAFACALAIVAFLGMAVYLALLQDYGPVRAACLSALAAAVVMGVLLATMRWLMQPASRPERAPSPAPLPGILPGIINGAQFPPKTVADVVSLVAAGIIAGLTQKR